jgi:Fic family protein
MDDFAVKFKAFAEQDLHPVALAAWVHCELGRIHPFVDGNGRLSRLLLNAILVRGGYEPVIFFNDDAYSLAVNEDESSPGAFATYLAKLIRQQNDEKAVRLLKSV